MKSSSKDTPKIDPRKYNLLTTSRPLLPSESHQFTPVFLVLLCVEEAVPFRFTQIHRKPFAADHQEILTAPKQHSTSMAPRCIQHPPNQKPHSLSTWEPSEYGSQARNRRWEPSGANSKPPNLNPRICNANLRQPLTRAYPHQIRRHSAPLS